MHAKLKYVVDRTYLEKSLVKSLTNFFGVPKGDGDIRMVCDATMLGLNDAL
jgi:hypothetical protein